MSIIRLKTAATVEPVSVTEVKSQCVVTASADDTLLAGMIKAAREVAENKTGAAFVQSTWEQVMRGFPAPSRSNPDACIELQKHPVISVTSITYVDGDGVTQTLGTDQYKLVQGGLPGLAYIYLAYGCSWPSARDQIDAVTITFVAGWAVTDSVPSTPENIKLWIAQRVATTYAQREDSLFGSGSLLVAPMPRDNVDGLLDRYTAERNV